MKDLYHEVYKSVAVMFASIPNFIEFYRETTNCSKEGPSCLRILNEVGLDDEKRPAVLLCLETYFNRKATIITIRLKTVFNKKQLALSLD